MTLIYFILILGVIIFIHELGHFIFAKKAQIHVYEFALGMGPKIFGFRRKNDETKYTLRIFPIGGFCSIAGEDVEEDPNIPKERTLQSKTLFQRFLVMIAGVMFNFVFAILILFIMALIFGFISTKPIVGEVIKDYPAFSSGLKKGDLILSVNGKKVTTWDDALIQMTVTNGVKTTFEVKRDNVIKKIVITPEKITDNGTTTYIYGIRALETKEKGIIPALKYSLIKFISLIKTMGVVLKSLFTGGISLSSLAGPVGIYSIVGDSAKAGFQNVIYLVALLSINIGFMNLLPIPALDGGKILFIIIEKIKGKPVNQRIENTFHLIGFMLLILLIIVVTFNDIIRLFKW